jgi:hypothetical protein
MFSAIIGRFLTSIAAWRLERGVDVASVEYIFLVVEPSSA